MVAYHFPPLAGSSGIQRTLRFARDLRSFGWDPIVLSAHPRAYEKTDADLIAEIPDALTVIRAQAFDSARHFSLAGRYPGFLARPDRMISWWAGAVPAGLAAIKRYRPDAIWSTYPIATAHLIGATLRHRSRLPWIADFRDPMAHQGYPPDAATWQSFKRVEERVFGHAHTATFTTPGALRFYRERYGECGTRMELLENGFDEAAFAAAAALPPPQPAAPTLLHSGIVYPEWRDPDALFAALARLRAAGQPGADRLRLRFRAPVHDAFVAARAQSHGIADTVDILPPVGYTEALAEMMAADALLVLQSGGCNDQIPAKTYEYLRAGRPILGLADPQGDTAELLRQAGNCHLAPLDDIDQASRALASLLDALRAGEARAPDAGSVARHDRRRKAERLAQLLECSIGGASVTTA